MRDEAGFGLLVSTSAVVAAAGWLEDPSNSIAPPTPSPTHRTAQFTYLLDADGALAGVELDDLVDEEEGVAVREDGRDLLVGEERLEVLGHGRGRLAPAPLALGGGVPVGRRHHAHGGGGGRGGLVVCGKWGGGVFRGWLIDWFGVCVSRAQAALRLVDPNASIGLIDRIESSD